VSDSGDLVKKTDTLLARYRGRGKAPEPDFPVLTEVVDSGGPEPEPPPSGDVPPPEMQDADKEAHAAEQLRLYLQAELTAKLKQALHEGTEERMRAALEQIKVDLDARLEAAVADAVARAVEDLLKASRPESR
jgi:hypothetical protein